MKRNEHYPLSSGDGYIFQRGVCDINESQIATFGLTIRPAGGGLCSSYVSLHNEPRDRRRNFTCQRAQHQLLGNLGRELVTALRPLGARARKAADWKKTLIVRLEPFARRSRYPAAQLHKQQLGRYSVAFVREARARPTYYDCGVCRCIQTLTP